MSDYEFRLKSKDERVKEFGSVEFRFEMMRASTVDCYFSSLASTYSLKFFAIFVISA